MEINPKDLKVPQLHGYLLGAVGPRPIAFASTVDKAGNSNLAPFSFFNVFSANPPILIFSPARSGRTNTNKHTFENIQEVPEVVINVVNYNMVHQMSLASSEYPKGISEFEKTGLTPIPAKTVKPFLVKESPVNLECKVNQVIELGSGGGAGNLIICEVTWIHINDQILNGEGNIDQEKIDLVARMGGNWYCRAHGDSIFEIEKPLTTLGIGVDSLPVEIKNSSVLTGNDLGQLACIEKLPDQTEAEEYRKNHSELQEMSAEMLHKHAQQLLNKNLVKEAWLALMQ